MTGKSGVGPVGVFLVVLLGGCTPSVSTGAQASPMANVHSFVGGCAGTVLTDAEPPVWAQGGWNVKKGDTWSVPWALGTGGDAVAFVFARQLVAGQSPRIDGTSNKVLWVAKTTSSTFVVDGLPAGRSKPAVSVNGGPSIVDVPTAGCWTFTLHWGSPSAPGASRISLEVLPAGTQPPSH